MIYFSGFANTFILAMKNHRYTLTLNIFRCKSKDVTLPKPGDGKCYRRVVHYPKKYTVEPIPYTRLGGRDPVSGRLVVKGIGGGIKHPYHWVDWRRLHSEDPSYPLTEKVMQVMKDGCRTANIALVAGKDKMRYILATENMKPGDIIKTSNEIPRIPVRYSPLNCHSRLFFLFLNADVFLSWVWASQASMNQPQQMSPKRYVEENPSLSNVRPKEGDTHPIGALPPGIQINCVETQPGRGGFYAHAAGTYATVVKRVGDRVIVQLPSKHEVSLQKECLTVIGRLSNILHGKTPIGSAVKNRELGNRPRSGWWQRKGGRFGRKIRPLPPLKMISPDKSVPPKILQLSF